MTFALVFAVFMAWMPPVGVLTQTVRVGPLTDGSRAAGRVALRRTLWIAALFTALALGGAALVPSVPGIVYGVGGMAFHVGWWWGAAPLVRRGRDVIAAERAASAPSSHRVASLVARDEEALLPPSLWAIPVALLVVSAVCGAWAFADGRLAEPGRAFKAAGLWAGGLSFLVAWGCWAVAAGRTRQDLSAASDRAEVDRLCREFRRFTVRSLFVLTTLAVLVFAGSATVVAVWGAPASAGRLAGWIGGAGGALVGLGGAVFGMLADRRRRAILELGGVPPDATLRSLGDADAAH